MAATMITTAEALRELLASIQDANIEAGGGEWTRDARIRYGNARELARAALAAHEAGQQERRDIEMYNKAALDCAAACKRVADDWDGELKDGAGINAANGCAAACHAIAERVEGGNG